MRAKQPTTLISTLTRPLFHPPLSPTPQTYHLTNLLPLWHPPSSSTRTLTTTPPLLKSGGKQSSKRTVPLNASKAQAQAQSGSRPVDAFDFTDYHLAIKNTHERLGQELGRVKAGGRGGGAEEIEGLRVILGPKKGSGGVRDGDVDVGGGRGGGGGGKERKVGTTESVRLGDVASVVARGRNVGVLVGEKEHLKPILSALATLPSLTPTTSPTDPLTLTVAIPPVTAESRLLAKKMADKKGEEALFALREARGAQRKRHRAMELGRLVGPDELRRAEREVERVNEGAVGEARRMVEGCRRGLEGG